MPSSSLAQAHGRVQELLQQRLQQILQRGQGTNTNFASGISVLLFSSRSRAARAPGCGEAPGATRLCTVLHCWGSWLRPDFGSKLPERAHAPGNCMADFGSASRSR